MLRKLSLLPLLALSFVSFSQRGKHTQAPYPTTCTVTSANYQMNAYTAYTGADITAPTTTLTVANNAMTSPFFTTPLGQGDLIMIIQMQGAGLDIDNGPTDYTVPFGHSGDWPSTVNLWGQVLYYFNAGYYELREVRAVSGSNTITLNCPTERPYTSSGPYYGHVQVVRIPRLSNLTLNPNTSIVPQLWDGATGGIVALEVDGNITFGANSKISATGYGFRGGVTDNTSTGAPVGAATDVGFPGSQLAARGGEKGEGIGGYLADAQYAVLESQYGKGAPGNGGGGGNPHNAGGGGGSNVGAGTYYGYGVPNPSYATAWNLETQSPNMVTTPSSGGGRGGYSYAITNQNELTVGPNNTAWGGDYRRNEGGYGGHALDYSVYRLFMGGGGGAGDMNGNQGGSGGRGGGIVFIQLYGSISGSMNIEANGAPGVNANPNGQNGASTPGAKYGNDGAGGAGGAGAIVISNGTALPAGNINAVGGKGGDQALSYYSIVASPTNECDGPGGGGSGGQISITNSGSSTVSVAGGASGVVTTATYPTTNFVVNFPPNGATGGASGISNTTGFFDITASNVSICKNNSTTLTATVLGTLPAGVNVTWYNAQYGGSVIGTGLTYNTPVLTTTTTYYVGTCPGTFRKPVVVTVGGATISGTAVVTNATCSSPGSITGLTTSGGVPAITIQWNGVTTPGMNLTNASAGTYTVVVTDGLGCTATSGPYTISSAGGPTINTTNMVVNNENCLGNNGSITGITASGTGLTYSWNSGAYNTLNISGLTAGNYSLTVTDNNGCTASVGPIAVGLNPGPSINTAGLAVTNETCSNSNGSISGITASGTGLTYSWTNSPATTLNLSSLAAGSYTLTVTNNLGCTATYGPINITNTPAPTINTTNMVLNDGHCGNSNGSISGITVSGGLPNYSYSWNSGAYNTLDISGLAAGNYSLIVTDANGCTANAGPFAIINTGVPTINTTNMVITSETCVGNNGSITGITATGSGLTYSWNFVTYPSADATGLSNGSYGLLVTDQYGCNAVAGPFNVGYIPGPSISATNLVITNETCSNSNGSIVGLQATGTGLTYDWNGTLTFNEDNTGIPAGNYTLTVTDNLGCTATYGPVNITNTPAPTISTTNMVITDENCNSANGSITGITVSGGLLNYTYSWNSGAYSTLDISSLPAGNYSLLVTDANGCAATAGPFTINNTGGPTINTTNILITPESCAGNDGSIGGITVTGTGLSYEWNSTPSPLNINNQTAGNYTLVVTDVNGCTATAGPFTIPASTTLSLDSSNMVITPAGCTVNSGSIEGLVIVGGVNPQFDWDNSSATLDNTGLASGTYVLDILDDQGCTVQASFYVGQTSPPVIGITNVIFDTVHCAQTDGGISGIDVTGGTEPYSYVWDGNSALNTLNISNQTAGNHTLVVTDDMGCQDSQTLLIPSVQGPVINAGSLSVTNSTCEQPNGSIQGLNVTGDQPFTYSWTNSSLTSLNLTGIVQGTYTLTVTDANGCQTTGNPISVTTTPLPLADFSYTPNTIIPNDLVSFTDETTNATPVTWAWYTDGAPFSNSENPVYTYTTEGNYVVMLVVTTATGCTDTVIKTIQVFGELIVPNVVTRNNDGVNDEFFVKNLKPNTKLVVENRWGSVVYTSDDYQNDWSGNDMEGIKLTEGTYFYQLITVDGKILQGNVYLLNH